MVSSSVIEGMTTNDHSLVFIDVILVGLITLEVIISN